MSFRGCLAKHTVVHPCLAANSAMKRKELSRHAITGRSLQRNVLGATSRCEKTTYCVAPFTQRSEDEKAVEMAGVGWVSLQKGSLGCSSVPSPVEVITHGHTIKLHVWWLYTDARMHARRPEMVNTGGRFAVW